MGSFKLNLAQLFSQEETPQWQRHGSFSVTSESAWLIQACPAICRTEAAANTSEISDKPYPPDKVMHLFEAFRSQVEQSLLFLKSVMKAEVYVRNAGDAQPQLLFRASAACQVRRALPCFQDSFAIAQCQTASQLCSTHV